MRLKYLFHTIGHIQAQLLLTLFFWLSLVPYGLLLRLVSVKLLPPGGW